MTIAHGRRVFILGLAAAPVTLITSPLTAQARTIWSVDEAYDALLADSARVIDVRSREDWLETGVGAGVWPISMREDPDAVAKKLKTMQTDPARVRRTDPGDPEKCPVFDLHRIYSTDETRQWASEGCRTAGIGCIECKKPLIDAVVTEIRGFRDRAQQFEENRELVRGIVNEGSERARDAARRTMADVREATGLEYG